MKGVSLMRRLRLVLFLCTVALVVGLAGCGWLWPNVPNDDLVAQSNLSRDLHPSVSESDAAALSSGNGAFAFDLYAEVAEGNGNVFFSPFSISSALAMTYAGARNTTEAQMAAALHFDLAQELLHPAFNAVALVLGRRNDLREPYEGKGFELTIANALWGERGLPFSTSYLDTLAVNYGAGLRRSRRGAVRDQQLGERRDARQDSGSSSAGQRERHDPPCPDQCRLLQGALAPPV
jgi:hypothetical protein